MNTSWISRVRRPVVTLVGVVLVLAGAGIAAARTMTGPPWAQASPSPTVSPSPDCTTTDCTQVDQTQVDQTQVTAVQDFFTQSGDCGKQMVAQTDLTDPNTLAAYSSLMDALNSGQTDHMVNGFRTVLQNCNADPSNPGLANAIYHLGLNWVRHYEHEMWLEQKFANMWPDGKPGGKPEGASIHGNPHGSDWVHPGGPDVSHGNAFGHAK